MIPPQGRAKLCTLSEIVNWPRLSNDARSNPELGTGVSSEPDSAPADLLNRAIWHSVKGFDTPYNYGRTVKRGGRASLSLLELAGL
jgi:hypothetical protein